jgi:hypothetical protein
MCTWLISEYFNRKPLSTSVSSSGFSPLRPGSSVLVEEFFKEGGAIQEVPAGHEVDQQRKYACFTLSSPEGESRMNSR